MLYRGMNQYHHVPDFVPEERNAPQASLVTSVIVPVALVAVVIMILVRLFT